MVNVSSPPDRTPPVLTTLSTIVSKRAVSGLRLGFSESLSGATATDLGAYGLVQAGRDRKFGTKDVVIRLRSATFDGPDSRVVLTARKKLQANAKYQLTISGVGAKALTDLAGNALDGDADARAGGDAVRRFSIGRNGAVKPSLGFPVADTARRLHAARATVLAGPRRRG